MSTKARRREPEIIFREGKPAAVIEDLRILTEMRQKPLKFKRLEDFLAEYKPVA